MMKKLLVISIDGNRYGIWKDDILSVREVSTVYRLPESPDWLAGISKIDDRTTHLIDIAALIGHRPFDRERPGCALIMSEGSSLEGFVADSEEARLDVHDGSTFPMPDYMVCNGIDNFVLHGSELLPVIKIKDVYRQLRSECAPPPAFTMNVSTLPRRKEEKSRDFWMFTINGENYAVRGDLIEKSDAFSRQLSSLPSTPDHVEGVVYDSGGIRVILNPGKRIGYQYGCDEGIVMFVKEGGPGLMVGSDAKTFSGFNTAVLPPLAASELMQFALINGRDIIPVLNIHALVSADPDYRKKKYTPRSRFHQHFGTREVRVLEFVLSDMVLGLPDSQVEDIIDVFSFRALREAHPLLLGVAELNGDLFPVLSLSPCFGRPARPGKDWKMIMMKNGNFRVLLLAEKVLNRRSLRPGEQKVLPISLPHRYVYGCYPDDNSVRLILDVATMAMYAGEGKVSDDLKTLMEKFVPCVPREAKEPVVISNGNTEMDNKKTIDHSEANPRIQDEIKIDNGQLNAKEEHVFVKSLNDDVPVVQELKGNAGGQTGSMHKERLECPPVTSSKGNSDLDEHHEFMKENDHEEISERDVFERADTGKQMTVPGATDDSMDKGPVNEERTTGKMPAQSPAQSPETEARRDKDVTEFSSSGQKIEKVESERGHCETPDTKVIAVNERDYNKGLKTGEDISVGPHEGRIADKKKEKEGSCVSFDAESVRNIDHADMPERILPESNRSLDEIEEAVPDKSYRKVKLPYTDHQIVKSDKERRGKGSYAVLALGIFTVLMVLFTYLFLAPVFTDLPAKSETGSAEDNVLEEPTMDVDKQEAVFSAVNNISSDQKMNPAALENLRPESVPDKRTSASEHPAFDNNDKTMTTETTIGNINESFGLSAIDKTKAYVVKRGDTLWDIAEHFTGNPFDYITIAADNDIKNPDLVFPGQNIVIHIKMPEERALTTDTSP